MFINSLWFIEQAWETVFNLLQWRSVKLFGFFFKYLWKTGSWKREVFLLLLSSHIFLAMFISLVCEGKCWSQWISLICLLFCINCYWKIKRLKRIGYGWWFFRILYVLFVCGTLHCSSCAILFILSSFTAFCSIHLHSNWSLKDSEGILDFYILQQFCMLISVTASSIAYVKR